MFTKKPPTSWRKWFADRASNRRVQRLLNESAVRQALIGKDAEIHWIHFGGDCHIPDDHEARLRKARSWGEGFRKWVFRRDSRTLWERFTGETDNGVGYEAGDGATSLKYHSTT